MDLLGKSVIGADLEDFSAFCSMAAVWLKRLFFQVYSEEINVTSKPDLTVFVSVEPFE